MKLRNRALGGAPLLAGAGLLAVFQLSGPGGLTFARAGAHQEWAWLGFASLLIGGLVGARRQPIRFGGLLGVGLVCAGAPLIATAAPLWSSPLHLWGAVALAVCLVAPA